jgi:hypothetical protein
MADTKVDELQRRIAQNPTAGAQGLYTPDDVDGIESERLAFILNNLVSRVNLDSERIARRRARLIMLALVLLGIIIGFVLTLLGLTLLWHPVDDLADVLRTYLEQQTP